MSGERDFADCPKPLKEGRPIRVLLVENDQLTAEAIVRDFGRHRVDVMVASSAAEARDVLRARPSAVDVVILELHLPDGRGESLLPAIEECPRQPATIIMSSFLPEIGPDVLEYRPVAVSKPVSTSALLRIVRTVAAGYTCQVIRRFVRRYDLSKRETETIALLAQGRAAKEIATRLNCSEKTIYFHLAGACQKTNCRDYHELFGRLFAFTCQALGHTPPEHAAFVDPIRPSATER